MDWPNERYVRLFTRNTTTWRRLLWDGQCMLLQLLRVVDRAGVLDIQDMPPGEACAMHTGAPPDVAERGVAKLLELGVILHEGTRLLFPNFLEAQECPMSDKQRAKVSREKRASQIVTAPSQNVTPASHAVTPSHAESHDVTPRHSSSVPTQTEPNQAVTSQPNGGGAVEVGDPIRMQASRGRKRLNEIPPGLGLDFDHGGKWQAPLATISRYPEAEWAIAAATIARAVASPTSRGFITPQHIVDYWTVYSRGETPGPKGPAWKDRQAADAEARKAAVEKQLAAFRADSERMVQELKSRDEQAAEELRLDRWRQHAALHRQLMGVAS